MLQSTLQAVTKERQQQNRFCQNGSACCAGLAAHACQPPKVAMMTRASVASRHAAPLTTLGYVPLKLQSTSLDAQIHPTP